MKTKTLKCFEVKRLFSLYEIKKKRKYVTQTKYLTWKLERKVKHIDIGLNLLSS